MCLSREWCLSNHIYKASQCLIFFIAIRQKVLHMMFILNIYNV